jgi:diguanylate cyclase (GGDEF)-like protein
MEAVVTARDWPLLRLPLWLVSFVNSVVGCYLAAVAVGVGVTPYRAHDVELFGVLLVFGVVSIELTRREGEATEFTKDVHGIWHIPAMILLPPIYSMLGPILKTLLTQWRVNPKPLHRRVFTAAAQGLSRGAASASWHFIAPRLPGPAAGPAIHWLSWAGMAAACAALQSVLNIVLVAIAVKGSDPSVSLRSRQFARDPLYNDLAEIAAGTLLAVVIAATGTWVLVALALPLVTLLHRSLRHAQLSDAARLDAKTGLLNANTWQREARAELVRAAHNRGPVTLAILDIDHFKQVNDAHGHLTGDNILVTLSGVFRRQLRVDDIIGRFGGEEFTILFPRTDGADATRIAERLRSTIAEMTFSSSGYHNMSEQVNITVSIGLSTAPSASAQTDLDELIIAADAALYRAKARGRNQVCTITDSSS